MSEKIQIIKKGGQIIDFQFIGDNIDCDYYADGEDIINAVILGGIDISDFFELQDSDLPSNCNIDILNSEISDDIVVGFGILREKNGLTIKFFFDDITDKGLIGEWGPYQYLKTVHNVATHKQNCYLISELSYDGGAYSMVIGCHINEFRNVKEAFLNGRRMMDEILLDSEILLRRIDKFQHNGTKFLINLPEELKTSIKQYLIFFEEYVYQAKGKKISLDVRKVDMGLEINLIPDEDISVEEIKKWLNEYVSFTKSEFDNIKVNFEGDTSLKKADILIADLKNQVAHLKNSVEIANLKANFLLDENKYLKELSISFVKSLPDKKQIKKKNEIKDLVAKGREREALKSLKRIFIDNQYFYNDLIILESRYNKTINQQNKSIISQADATKELNSINHVILDLTDKIE